MNLEHYVNNEEFLQAIIEHREKIEKAEENEEISIGVSEYIGECFLKIADGYQEKLRKLHFVMIWSLMVSKTVCRMLVTLSSKKFTDRKECLLTSHK